MTTISFWRRFSGRRKRRKNSFYASQHLMREAAEGDFFGSLRYLSDDDLQRIVEKEGGSRRAETARCTLEDRRKSGDKTGGDAA